MPVAATSAQMESQVSSRVPHTAPKPQSSQDYDRSQTDDIPSENTDFYNIQASTADFLSEDLEHFAVAGISGDSSPVESTSQYLSVTESQLLNISPTLRHIDTQATSPAYSLRESTRRRSVQDLLSPGLARSSQYFSLADNATSHKSESPSRKKRKLAHGAAVIDLTSQSPPPAAVSHQWLDPSVDPSSWQPARRLRSSSQRSCHTPGHRSPHSSRRRSRGERPVTRRAESPSRPAFQPAPAAPPPAPTTQQSRPPPQPQLPPQPVMYDMATATNPMSMPTFAIPVCTAPHHYPLCNGTHMPLCNTQTTWSIPGCGLPIPVCGIQHLPGCSFAQIPLTHAAAAGMPHNLIQSQGASHPLNRHPSHPAQPPPPPQAQQPSSSATSQSHHHQQQHHHPHHPHHPQGPVGSQHRGHPASHLHPHAAPAPHFLSTQPPLQPRDDTHMLSEHHIPFAHIPPQGAPHRATVAPSPAVLLQEPSVHPVPHGIYSPMSRLRRNSTSRTRWRSIPPPPPPYPGFLLHFLAMLGNPPMPAFGMDLGEMPHHAQNYDMRAEQNTTRTALLNLAERLGETKPRGLLKADIEQLPSYRFKADLPRSHLDQSSCVVCMYDFESKQLLRVLPCQHEFHAKCVDKWLKSNRTCPICRKDASEPASSTSKKS